METRNKKTCILNSAEELFCYYGSKDTTVRRIAQKAKINTAMVNYYFQSKENLFVIMFERKMKQFKEAEKMLKLKDKRGCEELLLYNHFLIDLIIDHLPFCKLMMKEKLSNENEKIVALIDSYFKSNQQRLKSILNRDFEENKRNNINMDEFIMIIYGFLIAIIFKMDPEFDISKQQNKIKLKEHFEKIQRSFLTDV